MRLFTWANLAWLILYIVLLGSAVATLRSVRDWSLRELSTAQSQRDWDHWRRETARQETTAGPVQRRQAKSVEPPTLVLLRDHFAIGLAAVFVFGTVLFVTLMLMLRGAMSTPATRSGEGRGFISLRKD